MVALFATVCILSHFPLSAEPAGLSGLTHVAGCRYCAVDDRGGRLYDLDVVLDGAGAVTSVVTNGCVRLAGRVDLEGCAWDPLERRIWVSDESDTSIRQFDPATGAETAVAPLPEVFRREAVPNRSIEALAISPDGRRMYAANEDTLRCDGSVATTNRGGVVRIQEFTRAGAGCPWTPSRQYRYRTRRIRRGQTPIHGGRTPGLPFPNFRGRSLCGVSALAVDSDGSLLLLERQLSRGKLPFPTFHAQIVRVRLGTDPLLKGETLWKQDTGLANYEGLAEGTRLPDGTQTWILVSDAGGGAAAGVLVLGFGK